MTSSPIPAIDRIRLDAEAQTATVTMSNGRILSTPTTTPHPWDALSSAEVDLATRELTMRLRTGECLVVELGTGGETDLPAPDRPVVYLDQLHWITLAQRLHSRDAVAEGDREPAARLIDLARSKLIALPLSSANLWEIAPTGPHRRDLALTMIELSRGWQLRDPISVRGQELRGSMSGQSPVRAEAVITLEPGAIFNADLRSVEMAGAPAEWNLLFDRVTTAEASFASILEDDSPGGAEFRRAVAASWAEPHQQLANHLRDAGTPARADSAGRRSKAARGSPNRDRADRDYLRAQSPAERGLARGFRRGAGVNAVFADPARGALLSPKQRRRSLEWE